MAMVSALDHRAVAVLLVALLAAGCGGDSKDGAGDQRLEGKPQERAGGDAKKSSGAGQSNPEPKVQQGGGPGAGQRRGRRRGATRRPGRTIRKGGATINVPAPPSATAAKPELGCRRSSVTGRRGQRIPVVKPPGSWSTRAADR